jgi:alpha-beta hydrolase superfamily lysophospholipase
MDSPAPRPFYLAHGGEQSFAIHQPAPAGPRAAVLFCPPFGWDEVCSYRVARAWSQRLSASGHQSLRLTFPSTGDSAGTPRDPDRLAAWIGSVDAGARWLRDACDASSVIVVGLGLGGAIAYAATAAGAPIDGLVLWSTPARTRNLVRQLKAFSQMELDTFFSDLEAPAPLVDELEAGGFLLSHQTLDDLSALDLTKLDLTGRLPRGALLLERDGLAVDARLSEALQRDGVVVTTAPGDGYAAMTSHPQRATMPEETISRIAQWISQPDMARRSEHPVASAAPLPRPMVEPQPRPMVEPQARPTAELEIDGRRISETPFQLDRPGGPLSGVLTLPEEELGAEGRPCAVFLNPGAARRIGPSRMWVEAARRWAARGIPSLRLDAVGIGESDGPPTPYAADGTLYAPAFVTDVTAALDELQRRGVGDRFLLVGLCAGAYWSLYAGLDDPRVDGMALLNLVAVVWDDGLPASRDLRRALTSRSWSRVRRNITWERVRAIARLLVSAPARAAQRRRSPADNPPSLQTQTKAMLTRLNASDKRVLMVFHAREALLGELERNGWLNRLKRSGHVTVRRIPVNDHTFRPVSMQTQVHAALDSALDQELAARPPGPVAASPLR